LNPRVCGFLFKYHVVNDIFSLTKEVSMPFGKCGVRMNTENLC